MMGATLNSAREQHEIVFEAYGVTSAVRADSPELLERFRQALPPGWRPGVMKDGDATLTVSTDDSLSFLIKQDDAVVGRGELDVAIDLFDAQVRGHIALHAPAHIFVHAGVVAVEGRAIVIPGRSFSGKTTLVAALVQAGAEYYSDEFAVIAPDGLVHPYPRPLSVRQDGKPNIDRDVTEFGGEAGTDAIPIGVVVVTRYHPEAVWEPTERTAGEGVLALIANTVPALDRPSEALTWIRAAVEPAVVLHGDRGDVSDMVGALLERVGQASRQT
jgi:hypothetical protein